MKVAIIGHGPSVVGKGWGNEIDSHDLVIRMANCDWQYPEDYGSIYTIGVFSEGPSRDAALISKKVPVNGYWYYRTDPDVRYSSGIDSFIFRELVARELRNVIVKYEEGIKGGYHLSRGTATVVFIVDQLYRSIKQKEITLYGFDAVMNGFQGREKHHPKAFREYDDHTIRLKKGGDTHDWAGERKLIKSLESDTIKIMIRQ